MKLIRSTISILTLLSFTFKLTAAEPANTPPAQMYVPATGTFTNSAPTFGYSYYNPYVKPGFYFYPAPITVPSTTTVISTKVNVPARTIPAQTIPATTLTIPTTVNVPQQTITSPPIILPSPVTMNPPPKPKPPVVISERQVDKKEMVPEEMPTPPSSEVKPIESPGTPSMPLPPSSSSTPPDAATNDGLPLPNSDFR